MNTAIANYAHHAQANESSAVQKVTTIMRWTYSLVPILAGLDKFTHILVNWDQYLAPVVTDVIPMEPHSFMSIVGVIEIIAGILVFIRPRMGSLVVAGWLLGIVINLLLAGNYYDVAVRDAVMAVGAFSLFLLSGDKGRK